MIFFYSIKLALIYLNSNQVSVTYTNPIFGKISPPVINDATSSAGLKFTLDTVEGTPVTTTDSANVYFLPQVNPRFGYDTKINLVAKSFGFDTTVTPYKLNGRMATFTDGDKTLNVDISNFNFKFDRNVNDNLFASLSASLTIPPETQIQNQATSFLQTVGRYPDELAKGTTNIIYLKYNPGNQNFVNVNSPSNAQLVEIDFYRPNVDIYPVVSPKFFTSQNYVVMLFQGNDYLIIKSQIAFFEKSTSQVGTYFIKTGDQAWKELNSGQGLIVAGTAGQTNISIKSMKLEYLDPDVYQSYLQPVYVFLGSGNFAAYVQAVKN